MFGHGGGGVQVSTGPLAPLGPGPNLPCRCWLSCMVFAAAGHLTIKLLQSYTLRYDCNLPDQAKGKASAHASSLYRDTRHQRNVHDISFSLPIVDA